MKKSIKLSLIVIFILIVICTVVVLWRPWKASSPANEPSSSSSSAVSSEVSETTESSQMSESSETSAPEPELSSELIPEDQPDSPDLNFETSGASYDDIMINVLTCILSQDMTSLSTYVGSQGLRLSPTGTASDRDIVLSAEQAADFFSLSSQSYGTYPGSGESITLTPQEYYNHYICPEGFDFTSATIAYNDTEDLARVNGMASEPKTVSYYYAPNVMEWKRLILVYDTDGVGDVLCGIIYQDLTTN